MAGQTQAVGFFMHRRAGMLAQPEQALAQVGVAARQGCAGP